ncbi:Rbh1p NDAI_0A00810 [Naumovozyma dairenensis CBS 421]|uniref:Uncharacterized protein n=1 Tax=Naumovozyma dairenensis (strain ATCC 10597 / BCRC 20456 / CBS 421 / NBRC 0211 / NRRL Y-12639) TaxID=1071378 RepID=G0W351_NAUDC|nr:hypothetical protein NDAI_0A00810 [Naumovozyma dairenensis CBS 421]CCD22239.1 hypothetical protein NDAI_0A00810 [Naumovozyma dairenensis CBS 421]
MMSKIDAIRKKEADHIIRLKQLHSYCQEFCNSDTGSKLDPLMKCYEQLNKVVHSLDIIISKHDSIYDTLHNNTNFVGLLNWFFNDTELLNEYNNILLELSKLILHPELIIFRSTPYSSLLKSTFGTYSYLKNTAENEPFDSSRLLSVIEAFEYQFQSRYTIANKSIIKLDKVHDLLSFSSTLIPSPLTDFNSFKRRTFFKLDLRKCKYHDTLVEVLQLTNGQLAVFKINSGELPFSSNLSVNLLQELCNDNFKLLDLGKKLLFSTLKQGDFEIINYLKSGIEIQTSTGNNTVLKLTCLDVVQWETYWKSIFEKLFGPESSIIDNYGNKKALSPSKIYSNPISNTLLHKKNHADSNADGNAGFKSKLGKLEGLKTNNNTTIGIAINIPTRPLLPTNNYSTASLPKSNKGFSLHRSKPLQSPLSSLTDLVNETTSAFSSSEYIAAENKNETNQNHTSLSHKESETSLKTIESLTCKELIDLDRSMMIGMSPSSKLSPSIEEYNFVSNDFTLNRVPSITEHNVEESDLESIMSESENVDTSSTFNPSADVYKPTLTRKTSNSILSLFKSRNKKNLTIDTSSNFSSTSLFDPETPTPSSAKEIRFCSTVQDSFNISSYIDINDYSSIFELEQIKISCWNSQFWEQISKSPLQLTFLSSRIKKEAFLLIHKENQLDESHLLSHLDMDITASMATAQDIQIRIPSKNLITSILKDREPILTIRSSETERLLNVLNHCRKGDLPTSLTASTTLRTLSTTTSSLMTSRVSRSVTLQSDLTDLGSENGKSIRSQLLLSTIKVKLHHRDDEGLWRMKLLGHADIYSQELNNIPLGIKISLTAVSKQGDSEDVVVFDSALNDIKRLGRTGILFNKTQFGDRLLEFTNRLVTEEVYRLILPL